MSTAQFEFLQRNQLTESYLEQAQKNYKSLLENFSEQHHRGSSTTRIIAINGSQGSGKSTLADYLCTVISERHNISTLALSLDDFYLTKTERLKLALDVHPLLATRGVP
jgi:D-glycerate 3-kinase